MSRGDRKRRPPSRRGRHSARPETLVGRRPVLEAIRAGAALEVMVSEGARSTPALRELVEAAGAADVEVTQVPLERVEAVAQGARHQGVAARVALQEPLGEAELFRRAWPEDALAVVLDGVTDPRNVGSLARTAEAAGADVLVVRRRRGGGITPAAVRASAGALLHLPVAEVANVGRAVERLREAGFWAVGLDAAAPTGVHEATFPKGPVVLVLGSEDRGLSRLVRRACDALVAIPMQGRVSSLNVSVAAGVVLFGPGLRGKNLPSRRQESSA